MIDGVRFLVGTARTSVPLALLLFLVKKNIAVMRADIRTRHPFTFFLAYLRNFLFRGPLDYLKRALSPYLQVIDTSFIPLVLHTIPMEI